MNQIAREVNMGVFRLFLIAACLSVPVWGQLTVSTLRGTVTDPTGALVPNARVTATNPETNLTRTVTTTENGDFEIVDLPRGSYRLTISHAGFKNFIAENVVLESSQVRRVDAALEVGAAGTEVTVHADAS